MNKQIYVVNNEISFTTKNRGIIGPGEEISEKDFNSPERFQELITGEKIVKIENYKKPVQDVQDNNTVKMFLRQPCNLEIPPEDLQILNEFCEQMKIPEGKRIEYSLNKLKYIARQNYQDVCFLLNNLSFQRGRINTQCLQSTLRKMKFLENELNYKAPAFNGLKSGTFL